MYFICQKSVQSALTPPRICVETRVFYHTILQWSCHVQDCNRNKNIAMHSVLNIKTFQAVFSTLYWIGSKWILHGKSAYDVRLDCRATYSVVDVHYVLDFTEKCVQCALTLQDFTLKHGCFIQRYRSDPAMYKTVTEPKI